MDSLYEKSVNKINLINKSSLENYIFTLIIVLFYKVIFTTVVEGVLYSIPIMFFMYLLFRLYRAIVKANSKDDADKYFIRIFSTLQIIGLLLCLIETIKGNPIKVKEYFLSFFSELFWAKCFCQ